MLEQLKFIFQILPFAFIQENVFLIPVWQMIIFVFIITFCIFFRKYQLGLLISFVFSFYWGLIVNRDVFIGNVHSEYAVSWVFILYIVGGAILVIVPLVSFFKS